MWWQAPSLFLQPFLILFLYRCVLTLLLMSFAWQKLFIVTQIAVLLIIYCMVFLQVLILGSGAPLVITLSAIYSQPHLTLVRCPLPFVKNFRVATPLVLLPRPHSRLYCSPLGAVPKKDGTFHIILDLSSPSGSSVNDGISQSEFSVHYSSFDDAVDLVRSLGHGCYMAKVDIRHAFRLCPVRPQDYKLLGMFWQGSYYVDTRLPFGCRSSPFIFNSFVAALAWIIIFVYGITSIIYYLDDFFFAASAESNLCSSYMDTILSCF